MGILVIGFFIVILWKLMTGEISLHQLLEGDDAAGFSSFSPGRAQLLITTLLTGLNLIVSTAKNPSAGIPAQPDWLVASLGGSQAVYLLGKAWSMRDRRQ